MRINKSNYEEYLIDYMDGNLSSELCDELELFLEKYPEIRAEFDGLDEITLHSVESRYEEKENLLKNFQDYDADSLEVLFVKKLEGDLSEEEILLLDELLIQFPEKLQLWNFISQTKLKPECLEYDDKAKLHAYAPIDYSIPSNLIIGKLEGDLSTAQSTEYEALHKKDEQVRREVLVYSKLKLSAPLDVIYKDKKGLKKGAVILMWPRYAAAIAAAVLVLLSFRFYFVSDSGRLADRIQHGLELREVVVKQNVSVGEDLNENKLVAVVKNKSTFPRSNDTKQNKPEKSRANKINALESSQLASIVQNKDIVIPKPTNEIATSLENESFAYENSSIQNNEFPTVLGMIEGKVKEQLWGNTEYPEENYLLALSGKAVERLTENTETDVEVDVSDVKNGGLFVKIGRFSVERNR